MYCRISGKKFILAGANDANFDRKHELNVRSYLDALEIRYELELADKIILQNKKQKSLLKQNYGRDGLIFHNLYDPPSSNYASCLILFDGLRQATIVMGSRLARQKRPELCLHLADLLSDYEIVMVSAAEH